MPLLARFGLQKPKQRIAATLLTAVLFVFIVLAIGGLARQALEQLRLLNTANSDNLQWTLSQTEVEFLQLHNAVLQAQLQPDGELQNLRRWFDVFVSRMGIIRRGPIYSTLAREPQMVTEFNDIDNFVMSVTPYIDGPDENLRARLPDILAQASKVRPQVRNIALEGIRVFSKMADNQREDVSGTMLRIASLTVSLILMLVLAVFFLTRIYRTAKQQAAENLSTRERLQAMLNTSLDAVLVVDRQGKFVEFNGAATEIFGFSEAEVLGKDMTDLIFADGTISLHAAGLRQKLENGQHHTIGTGRVKVEAKRKSGEVFPVELSVAKTKAPDGDIFVIYLRDISDLIQAEARLTMARDEALAGERAKARFMAVMSHEMRTPLNGLLGSLELLKETRLTQKQFEFADVMQKSGELLLHHVNDVLDIARLENGRMGSERVALNLDHLVQEVLESQMALAQGKGLALSYRPEVAPIGAIMGSAIGLRQVLLNLVNNAIKFTEKGLVEVQASVVEMDGAQRLSLRVRDTGMGIAPADQARVFDDFVTLDSSFGRRADGTGLGLGIARRIVQSMGGELGVISQPKLGSTFWADLPFEAAVDDAAPAPAALPAPKRDAATRPRPVRASSNRRNLEILVVEDNPINRFILREMLLSDGHCVTEAVDGLEGVTLASARKFDLIFMDISMPALDGIAATVRLRAGNGPCAQAPIVALTAHALPDDRALFLASGMNAVLNKPLDRAMLLHVMEELTLALNPTAAQTLPVQRGAPPNPQKSPSKAGVKAGKKAALTDAAAKAKTAASARAKMPILRAAMLDELTAALGQDRLNSLIARFISEGNNAVPASLQLLSAGDHAKAQAMLHSLAGAAATFGAVALQACLAQMESHLKGANGAAALAAHPELAALWAQTTAALAAR